MAKAPRDPAIYEGEERTAIAGAPQRATLLPSLALFQCRRCFYLTAEGALLDRRRRCPHCKQAGERRLFPSLTVLSSFDLLHSLYVEARRQHGAHTRAFARAFRKRYGCTLSDAAIVTLAAQVASAAAAERSAGAESGMAVTAADQYASLGATLGLASDGETEAAYGELLLFSTHLPLDGLVVMLADAVLRELVREVLLVRLQAGGAGEAQAAARLSPATDLPGLERVFVEITRHSLREELEQHSEGDFAADWWALSARLQRGLGAAIDSANADTAFRLVSECAAPIAGLANAVVAGRKQFHLRRPRRGAA